MIIRGTTPTHVFHIPFPLDGIIEAYITYEQDGRIAVDKRLDDIDADIIENTLSVQLSQDNTLAFCFNKKPRENIVVIQIKLLFKNNIVTVCRPIRDKVADSLSDGRMTASSTDTALGDTVIWDGGEFKEDGDLIYDGGGV